MSKSTADFTMSKTGDPVFWPAEPLMRRSIQRKRGRPVYVSQEAVLHTGRDGWTYLIHSGATTDWNSVPRILSPIVPVDDKAGLCALLHDDLLQRRMAHGLTRAECDQKFYEALLLVGVAPWRAGAMYWGVRWQAWTTGDK
jgi:hypothetical protein